MQRPLALVLTFALGGCSFLQHATPAKDRRFRTSAIVDTALVVIGAAVCAGGVIYEVTRPPHGPGLPVHWVLCGIGAAIAAPYGVAAIYGWSRADE